MWDGGKSWLAMALFFSQSITTVADPEAQKGEAAVKMNLRLQTSQLLRLSSKLRTRGGRRPATAADGPQEDLFTPAGNPFLYSPSPGLSPARLGDSAQASCLRKPSEPTTGRPAVSNPCMPLSLEAKTFLTFSFACEGPRGRSLACTSPPRRVWRSYAGSWQVLLGGFTSWPADDLSLQLWLVCFVVVKARWTRRLFFIKTRISLSLMKGWGMKTSLTFPFLFVQQLPSHHFRAVVSHSTFHYSLFF